jgi:hypothetical protein
MKTWLKPITNIQSWRLAAIMIGSTLAMTLAVSAFAGGPPPPTPTPTPHSAPTAIAAISPAAVYPGDTVTLDASASDSNPPGSPLTYQWNQLAPGSPTISLSPNTQAKVATFAAPIPGAPSLTVTFRVRVTDDLAPNNQKNSFSALSAPPSTLCRLPTLARTRLLTKVLRSR